LSYVINHTCYRQVFILPKELVEKHLKLSGALQLKVLLWVFYHQGIVDDLNQIAQDLGASPSDVQDALQYWIVNKMILPIDDVAPVASKPDTASGPIANDSNAKSNKLKSSKPKHFEVARRMKESPEIAFLMVEAQAKFGRNLTEHERSTLTYLVDAYGISPAVLLMVIEYAVTTEHCNIRYIEKTAIDWVEHDIDSVEKAEIYLTKMEEARLEWNTVCRVFGLDNRKPSKQEQIYVARWLGEWHFKPDMLKEAYDQCVNNTGKISFPYINKVLNQWYNAKCTKPAEISAKTKSLSKSSKRGLKNASENIETSYTIEEIEQLL